MRRGDATIRSTMLMIPNVHCDPEPGTVLDAAAVEAPAMTTLGAPMRVRRPQTGEALEAVVRMLLSRKEPDRVGP